MVLYLAHDIMRSVFADMHPFLSEIMELAV